MQYKFEKPVKGTIGTENYKCTIEWRNGQFIADEPATNGGKDEGPDPYTLLLSSLASCTLITLRMYIERKGWNINGISVDTNMFQTKKEDKAITTIDRDIRFADAVTQEQCDRLYEIASACPISKILEGGNIVIRTYIYDERDTEKKLKYSNGEVTIVWKPDVCKHAGRCVTGLPEVFDTKKRPWINAGGATTEQIIAQVNKCPTGALSYFMNGANNDAVS